MSTFTVNLKPGDSLTVTTDPPIVTPPPPTPPPTTGTVVPATSGALASAISAAATGATLLLRGGTHSMPSQVTTSKALTIAAYTGEVPVITHATRRPDFLYFTGGPVTVRQVVFQAGAGTYDDSMGSALSETDGAAHDVLYEDCTFIGTSAMGERQQFLYVRRITTGGGPVTIRRCSFKGMGADGFGVHAYPGPGPANVVVEDCDFDRFDRSGGVTSEVPITVRHCLFTGNNIAVQLRGGASGSVITDNTGSGNKTTLQLNGMTNVTNTGNTW